MKIFSWKEDIVSYPFKRDLALVIGNFDGVHLGHQFILKEIIQQAEQENLDVLIMTFVPHPKYVLQQHKKGILLCSYQHRRELLEQMGVNWCWEIAFDRDFSMLSHERFLTNYVFAIKRIKKIFLGYDTAFGKNKSSTVESIRGLAALKGCHVASLDEWKQGEEKVSSQRIRSLIDEGRMTEISAYLGRNYSLDGNIIKGKGRGKKIGFATANLQHASEIILPPCGVYVSRTFVKQQSYLSVSNIGINPTFGDLCDYSVETHILDFDQDIYGERVIVEFLKFLRPEQKFSKIDELIEQIDRDVAVARDFGND